MKYIKHAFSKISSYSLSLPQSVLLIMLLTSSVIVNVLLTYKVSTLKSAIQTVKSEGRLQIGAIVPTLAVQGLNGTATRLSFSDSAVPTIVYVFSPQCGWCTRNMDNILKLASNVNGKYNVIGISLSSKDLESYIRNNNIQFPVFHNLEEGSKKSYKLGGTPQTLVISSDNRVLQNWMGVYSNEQQKEVEKYFNVELPGLRKPEISKN